MELESVKGTPRTPKPAAAAASSSSNGGDAGAAAAAKLAKPAKAKNAPEPLAKERWKKVFKGLEIVAMPSSTRQRSKTEAEESHNRWAVVLARFLLSAVLIGLTIQIGLRYANASSSVVNEKKINAELELPAVTVCPLAGGAFTYDGSVADLPTCTTDFGADCGVTGEISFDLSFTELTNCLVINGASSSAVTVDEPLQQMTITTFLRSSELEGFNAGVAFLHPQDFAANNQGVNTSFVTFSTNEITYLLITKRTERFLGGDYLVKYRTQTSGVEMHPDRLDELLVDDFKPIQLVVMYDSLFVQNIKEEPAPGFIEFIAEFGGVGSLLIGLSIVLFGEYAFNLFERCWFERRERKQDKVVAFDPDAPPGVREKSSAAQEPWQIELLVTPDFVAEMIEDEDRTRNRVYFVTFFLRVSMSLALIVYTVILSIQFTNADSSPSTVEFDERTAAAFPSVRACAIETDVALSTSCGGVDLPLPCIADGEACSHSLAGNCIDYNDYAISTDPAVATAPLQAMEMLFFVNHTMASSVLGAQFQMHPFGSGLSTSGVNVTLFTAPFPSHTYVQTTNTHEKVLNGPVLSNYITKTAHLELNSADRSLMQDPDCYLTRLSLSYDTLTLETVTENPPPNWLDYLAQFGGTSGLLMGLSVGGFVEYVFSFVHSRRLLAKKKRGLEAYRAGMGA